MTSAPSSPLAWMLHHELQLAMPSHGMALFLSTALSITSIPMLGSILLEHGLTRTPFGVVAITAAELGASLWSETALRDALKQKLAPVVDALFLPVFFALTGLSTGVGQLDTANEWLLCSVVFVAACAGKILGCAGAARMFGMPLRESLCVGVLMNTRALMGLVAIEVGRSIGVIDGAVYTMLVLMAIATTLMTTPLLRRLAPDSPPAAASAPPRLRPPFGRQ